MESNVGNRVLDSGLSENAGPVTTFRFNENMLAGGLVNCNELGVSPRAISLVFENDRESSAKARGLRKQLVHCALELVAMFQAH